MQNFSVTFIESQRQKLLELQNHMLGLPVSKPQHESLADETDIAAATTDLEFAMSLLGNKRNSLLEIEAALRKIDNGTYGVCEMSGEIINMERLEAIPFARFTIVCQAQMEKNRAFHRPKVSYTIFDSQDDDAEEEEDEKEV